MKRILAKSRPYIYYQEKNHENCFLINILFNQITNYEKSIIISVRGNDLYRSICPKCRRQGRWRERISYGTDAKNIGLGVKGLYNLTDPIRFEAAANYWLKKDGVTCWDVQANAHYLFKVGDMLAIYPLGGVGYMRASVDAIEVTVGGVTAKSESTSDGDIFFNLGGGAQYNLKDNIAITRELKYQFKDNGQLVIYAGIAYKF